MTVQSVSERLHIDRAGAAARQMISHLPAAAPALSFFVVQKKRGTSPGSTDIFQIYPYNRDRGATEPPGCPLGAVPGKKEVGWKPVVVTLYLDSCFLVNLGMNLWLLFLVKGFLKLGTSRRRLLAAAAVGGAGSCEIGRASCRERV